ncbi:S-adenosyl-L-methionine-dependent methyltransferase [Roridomyces roridus]|uniref:S-adenosyl-L-methionine-dependent methyltransferase n=1 Tax=Roridomyces roridus TaxID=1738132 RepID=A0AAD7BXB9_9AGAR|nr:S-adenosyl-L-methionine-dependent methyltransferase [Roridomyces roridus]
MATIADSEFKLKESHGRGMNTLNEDYLLPADEAEMQRLSIQHRMWQLMVGGLYPPEFEVAVGKALEGPEATALDAGCGSAIWCIEMAQMYPQTHVVGVDLAKNFQQHPPANFESIQADMSNGIAPCKNSGGYDLIHVRSVIYHMKDSEAFLRNVHSVLKPDGILILGDGNGLISGTDKEVLSPKYPTAPTEGESWLAGWQQVWLELLRYSFKPMQELVEKSPFDIVASCEYFCPMGWDGGLENGAELGDIALRNTVQWARAAAPAILASKKYDTEMVDAWLDAIEDECKTKKFYLPWVILLARPGGSSA